MVFLKMPTNYEKAHEKLKFIIAGELRIKHDKSMLLHVSSMKLQMLGRM